MLVAWKTGLERNSKLGWSAILAVLRSGPHRSAVRTSPFHGGNTGSSPVGDTNQFSKLDACALPQSPARPDPREESVSSLVQALSRILPAAPGHHRPPAPPCVWHGRQLLPHGSRSGCSGRNRAGGAGPAASGARALSPGHVSRGRNQPLRPGDHGWRAGIDRRRLRDLRNLTRRLHGPPWPRHRRRRSERPPRSIRTQDRPRPGLHQCMQDRGHRREQCLRNVLRHRAEQLSHAGRSARGAGRWLAARHRRPAQRRGLSPKPCSLAERTGATGRCHPRRYRTGRAHSPQVQDQEHHRLQPERADRLRGPDRDTLAPHDRLGGHAWLPLAHHSPHRRRRSLQGQRAGLLSDHRNCLPGRHSPQAAARLGGRTARPFRPALGARTSPDCRRSCAP